MADLDQLLDLDRPELAYPLSSGATPAELGGANSKADFDEDPAALAGKPSEVDSISGELTSSEADYAMGLWKTWLASYGYEVASGWADAYSKDPHPLSQRSQPIRTAIVEVFGAKRKQESS